jgi:hypothetical protein
VSYFRPLVLPLRVPTSRLRRGVQVRRLTTRGKSIGRPIVSAVCAESRASAATCFRSRRRFRRIRTAYVTCAASVSARFPAAGRSASPELLTERAGACVGPGGLCTGAGSIDMIASTIKRWQHQIPADQSERGGVARLHAGSVGLVRVSVKD